MTEDPRIGALPDSHGHAKGEHKPFAEERPIPYTARMLFLWFYHACKRGAPRFMMVADHINYLTFEDPAAVHVVRRALKLAQAGDLYGAAETAGVELGHASVVSEGLRKGMRYSIGAEMDNDPRSRPDAQNIVDAMKPDGLIRSIHFLPITHPQHGEGWMWPFDNPEFKEFYEIVGTERVWELYMETLLEAIEKLPGHIVGHFYVPAKFGHWPDEAALEAYEDRFVDACAQYGKAIEINSRYLYKYYAGDEAGLERYRAAHLRLMRKAKEKNVMIAVGSDAHSPRDQGNGFEAVLALLDEADINEIAFPLNDRVARVALRATEEILRQHSAALAALAAPPVSARQLGGSLDAPDDEDEDDAVPAPAEAQAEAAEIILPPGTESKIAAEAAERAEVVRAAEAAEAAKAEAAARPAPKAKAPPKPRRSRAKPKAVAVLAESAAADGLPAESAPAETAVAAHVASDASPESLDAVGDAEPAEPVAPAGHVEPVPAGEVEAIFSGDSESLAEDAVESMPDRVFANEFERAPGPRAARRHEPSRAAAPSKSGRAPAGKPAKKTPVPKTAAVAPAPTARKAAVPPAKSGEKKPDAVKKAPAKKPAPAAKKAAAKKAAPAKKTAAKKPAVKKAATKKAPAKKPAPARKNVATAKAAAPARGAKTSKKTAVKKSAKKKSSRR